MIIKNRHFVRWSMLTTALMILAIGCNFFGGSDDRPDACNDALKVTCTQFAEAYVKASNTGAGDWFGFSVAMSGNTLAVSAYREDSSATGVNDDQTNDNAPDSGAVYIFTRSGTTWSQQAYLKASNTDTGDWFGHSIALSGNTLAVGAPIEDSNANVIDGDQGNSSAARSSGAVYVFTRSGTTWSQQAYLKASNSGAGDRFGLWVALSDDTLAVSADREDSSATESTGDQTDDNATDSGAVYIFTRSGTTWSQQAYLKASNSGAGDRFGLSIALLGDTLAVGAPFEDSNTTVIDGDQGNNSATNSGAVYVFTRSGNTWSRPAYLKASNADMNDLFGFSVALSGDTLAVGAEREAGNTTGVNGDQANNSAPGSGAVYLFTRSGTTWKQTAYLKASNTDAGDSFGAAVALSGDRLAVGARYEAGNATGVNGNQDSNSAPGSGAVYLFTRSDTTWKQTAYLKASNTDTGDLSQGGAVVLSGNTLVAGVAGEDSSTTGIGGNQGNNSAKDSGAVYVWRIAP